MTVGVQVVGQARGPKPRDSVRRGFRTGLVLAAVVGVPITVLGLTGGLWAIPFWFEALFSLVVSYVFGPMPFWVVGILPSMAVIWVLGKIFPNREEIIGMAISGLLWVVGGTICFFTQIRLDDSRVRLPADPVQLGVLAVIGVSLLTSWTLLRAAEVMGPTSPAGPPAAPLPAQEWVEPDSEFWSPQPIVAWRAWRWTGSTLRGVFSDWVSSEFEASCDECDEPPGWGHVCGVYAVPSPQLLSAFINADVIGRVELSGLVIEHEGGFRASHVRILELWARRRDIVERLRIAFPSIEIHLGDPPDKEA